MTWRGTRADAPKTAGSSLQGRPTMQAEFKSRTETAWSTRPGFQRLSKLRTLIVDELQMVVDVLDVVLHHAADGHISALVMGAPALKGRIGQLLEHARKLPAADFKKR